MPTRDECVWCAIIRSMAAKPSTNDSHWLSGLVVRIVLAVTLLIGIGALEGLMSGGIAADDMTDAVIVGVLAGALLQRNAMKERVYRRAYDPADRTIHPPEPGVDVQTLRRYGMPLLVQIPVAVLVVASTVFAVWKSFWWDIPAYHKAAIWLLAAYVWGTAAVVRLISTSVRPDGIVVRTPFRRWRITWDDLSEVRWDRQPTYDMLVLHTADGRKIKALGVIVTPAGDGDLRMLQLRDDIEHAWAAALGRAVSPL
jgi:hypothetical protein